MSRSCSRVKRLRVAGILVRARAHRRLRRRRRPAQRLQHLSRRSRARSPPMSTGSRGSRPPRSRPRRRVISSGRPRIELSVSGRREARAGATARPKGASPKARSCPVTGRPLPRIMELRGGIPLWVFPRTDLPTVTGAIVMPGGAGVQQPGQAGLAHLAVAMLEEGTISRSAEQIALAAESMGATISTTCGWGGAYVSFKCLTADYAASPRAGGRHPAEPDVSGGGMESRPRPDAGRAQGRARPR